MADAKTRSRKRAGLKVLCPVCQLNQFETTGRFYPDKAAHPGMVRQIDPYQSWGWAGVPPDPSAGYGSMECGACGSQLAPSGKLTVEESE